MTTQRNDTRLTYLSAGPGWPTTNDTPLELTSPGHRAIVRRDADWGGPVWAWGTCTCGWTGTEYSNYHPAGHPKHGYLTEAFEETLGHTGANTETPLTAALTDARTATSRLADLANQATDAASAADADTVIDLLRTIADQASAAAQPVSDAELLATLGRNRRTP